MKGCVGVASTRASGRGDPSICQHKRETALSKAHSGMYVHARMWKTTWVREMCLELMYESSNYSCQDTGRSLRSGGKA